MKKLLSLIIALLFLFPASLSFVNADDDCVGEPKCTMQAQQKNIDDTKIEWEKKSGNWWYNNPKKEAIEKVLEAGEDAFNRFANLSASAHITDENIPDAEWDDAYFEAKKAIAYVKQVYVNPIKPAGVPEGDLLQNFIPQLIRQLFRFAYLAIFISFLVSGTFLITVLDEEERLTKAKQMIYYSMMGFAFITLAFAIVKAVTDIDFFMTGF